jgi:hypothetical protein
MKRFLQLLELAVKILPLLISVVKALESAVPVGGQGVSKGEMLVSIVEAVYEEAGDELPPLASVIGMVGKLASGVVSLFKKTGMFQ